MERKDHIYQVTDTLERQIARIQAEYDLSLAEMLGILECIKLNIYHQNAEPLDDEDDETA